MVRNAQPSSKRRPLTGLQMPDDSFTPIQALDALASLAGYRERLTSQAAGIVWMIWGLVITPLPIFFAAAFQHNLNGGTFMAELAVAVALCAGAGGLATNAVWRAHALEQSARPARWIAYASSAGVLVAAFVLAMATDLIPIGHLVLGDAYPITGLSFAGLGLLGSAGAATISLLQRTRVSPGPGLACAFALLALTLMGRYGIFAQDDATQATAALVYAAFTLIGFFAVGVWTMRRR